MQCVFPDAQNNASYGRTAGSFHLGGGTVPQPSLSQTLQPNQRPSELQPLVRHQPRRKNIPLKGAIQSQSRTVRFRQSISFDLGGGWCVVCFRSALDLYVRRNWFKAPSTGPFMLCLLPASG